jgi:hypothetical protein
VSELPSSGGLDLYPGTDAPTPPRSSRPPSTPSTGKSRYAALAGPLLLAGVGISAALPASVTAALGAVQPRDAGTASGAVSTLQRVGAGLGVALTAAVFAAHGSLGSAGAYVAGFRPALGVAAGLSLLGAVTALAVRTPERATFGVQPTSGFQAWFRGRPNHAHAPEVAEAGGRQKVVAISTGSRTA